MKAKVIVANGPMGVFEREEFALGTVGVFRAIGGESSAFSVVGGGGHSIASIYQHNIKGGISHVSTGGGGAMLSFFAGGEKLPVLEAFRISYERFRSRMGGIKDQ